MKTFLTYDPATANENAFTLDDLRRSRSDTSMDKSQFILSYISSQRVYLKLYASEGRKAQASWRCTPAETMQEQTGSVLDAGFSTPLLKPRVAKIPDDMQHALNNVQAPGDLSFSNSSSKDGSNVHSGTEQVAKWFRLKQTKNLPPSCGESRAKRTMQSSRNPVLEPEVSIARKGRDCTRKRKKSPDSERQALLFERRQRRCIKKAIVEPKKGVHGESDESRGPAEKRESSKKSKAKGKGAGLAAGLALMHGFSTTNIGAKRLTLNPSFGVFKKGKASAKTETSQKGKQKAGIKLWSEEAFLSRSPVKDGGTSQPEPGQSIPDSTTSPSAKESTRRTKTKARPKPRKAGRSSAQEDHSEVTISPCLSNSSRYKVVKPTRPPSITWDIESDGQPLPSSPAIPATSDGSVIADTRAIRWNKLAVDQKPSQHMLQSNQCDKPSTPIRSHAKTGCAPSEVSLAPSQSASQAIPNSSGSIELGSTAGPAPAGPALGQPEHFPLPSHGSTLGDCAAVENLPFARSSPLLENTVSEHYERETPDSDNFTGFQGDFSAGNVFSQYLLSYDDHNAPGDATSVVENAADPFAFDHTEGSTWSHRCLEPSYYHRMDSLAYACGNEDMQYTCMNNDFAPTHDDLFTVFPTATELDTFCVADDNAFHNDGPPVESNYSISQDYGEESSLANYLPIDQQGRRTAPNPDCDYVGPAVFPDDFFGEGTHSSIVAPTDAVVMESEEDGLHEQAIPLLFANGRALLHGTRDLWSAPQTTLFAGESRFQTVSDMEKYVAKQLRDHWRPQKL